MRGELLRINQGNMVLLEQDVMGDDSQSKFNIDKGRGEIVWVGNGGMDSMVVGRLVTDGGRPGWCEAVIELGEMERFLMAGNGLGWEERGRLLGALAQELVLPINWVAELGCSLVEEEDEVLRLQYVDLLQEESVWEQLELQLQLINRIRDGLDTGFIELARGRDKREGLANWENFFWSYWVKIWHNVVLFNGVLGEVVNDGEELIRSMEEAGEEVEGVRSVMERMGKLKEVVKEMVEEKDEEGVGEEVGW